MPHATVVAQLWEAKNLRGRLKPRLQEQLQGNARALGSEESARQIETNVEVISEAEGYTLGSEESARQIETRPGQGRAGATEGFGKRRICAAD